METKLFEVRDRMTFLPVICTKLQTSSEAELYLLASIGYGTKAVIQEKYVLYAPAAGGEMVCSPGDQDPSTRTHPIAHKYILEQWDNLKSGDVIDVEYILGENTNKKLPQRLTTFNRKHERNG